MSYPSRGLRDREIDMPEERVELSRGCPRGILSPLRLPFRHSGPPARTSSYLLDGTSGTPVDSLCGSAVRVCLPDRVSGARVSHITSPAPTDRDRVSNGLAPPPRPSPQPLASPRRPPMPQLQQ